MGALLGPLSEMVIDRRFHKGGLDMANPAPDFALRTVDGLSLSLSEVLRAKCSVLLVFLRHLG
jgi:hypothetical protein